MLGKDRVDRESVLVALRREHGLSDQGNYRFYLHAFNRLVLQSGITIGLTRFIAAITLTSVVTFVGTLLFSSSVLEATIGSLLTATALPYLILRMLRGFRRMKFNSQFADALDTIVRSLRAGHPVPIAIAMVGREMADPIGSEFGMVSDEITYGADLEAAMQNLYCRSRLR